MNLIKSLIARVLSLLGLKDMSVDGAIASFKKAVARLEEIAQHHDAEVKRQDQVMLDAASARSEASVEADRARSVAQKLSDLVGE